MEKIISLIFFAHLVVLANAQNRLKSDKTWLVYENKGKNIIEQIILKADNPDYFYQSTRTPLTLMPKDTLKSTETKHFYTLQGQKGEYEFLPGTAIMIARPELGRTITWEVFDSFTRINPDGSRSVFRLKR